MKRREFLKVAGTLALVASASALTGCGGSGDSGNSGSSGGNGGTGGGSGGASGEKPGGETGGSSGTDDSGNTKPEKLTYKNSKTAAYFARKGVTATNFYMEGTVVKGNWTGKVMLATLGQNTRYRKYIDMGASRTGWNILIQGDTAYEMNDKRKQYQFYADSAPSNWTETQVKSSVLRFKLGEGFFAVPADNGDVLSIQKTKVNVNGTDYEAETIFIASEKDATSANGYAVDYCFSGDDLVYIVHSGYTTAIRNLKASPDPSLVEIPEEYTIVEKGIFMPGDWEF